MNTGVLRRPIRLALAAVVCGSTLMLAGTAPSEAQETASSASATVTVTDSAVAPAGLFDGFHW